MSSERFWAGVAAKGEKAGFARKIHHAIASVKEASEKMLRLGLSYLESSPPMPAASHAHWGGGAKRKEKVMGELKVYCRHI
jgi:hypothetical protein